MLVYRCATMCHAHKGLRSVPVRRSLIVTAIVCRSWHTRFRSILCMGNRVRVRRGPDAEQLAQLGREGLPAAHRASDEVVRATRGSPRQTLDACAARHVEARKDDGFAAQRVPAHAALSRDVVDVVALFIAIPHTRFRCGRRPDDNSGRARFGRANGLRGTPRRVIARRHLHISGGGRGGLPRGHVELFPVAEAANDRGGIRVVERHVGEPTAVSH
mmetsp:Transcript_31868/g.98605  ORF Transcript_31868/g.98605 Transcript_31868/m.98605 type:complete len:216 (+) Transcript_31868:81-728(+)